MFGIVYNDKNIEGLTTRCYPINSIKGQELVNREVSIHTQETAKDLPNENQLRSAIRKLNNALDQQKGSNDNDNEYKDWDEWKDGWKKYFLQSSVLAFLLGIGGMYLIYIVSKFFWKMIENKLITSFDLSKSS